MTLLRRLLPFYLPIIALPLLLFAEPILNLEALYWGTPGLQFIPWRMLIWQSIRTGELPLWNPYNGMGAPLIANYQTALFYPPSWLLYLFAAAGGAPWLAWAHTLLLVVHIVWAAVGMERLLKRLGLGDLARMVGAVVFSAGGFFIARGGFFSIVWTAAWLPWIILAASQITHPEPGARKRSMTFLPVGLVVATGMMLLAGHAQLSWYILLLGLVWVLSWVSSGQRMHINIWPVIRYGCAVVCGAILAAVQLFPTAEYLYHSQRSGAVDYEAALTYSFWPWRFLTLFIPDLFGHPGHGNYWGYANYWEDAMYLGMLPILLAGSTFFLIWKREKNDRSGMTLLIRFAWAVTVIGFLLALGKHTPVFLFLFDHVPTFDMFNAPARWLIWPVFGLTLLASIGVDRMKKPVGRGLYWLRLATAGGFAVTLGAFLGWYLLSDVNTTFIKSTALAGMWGLGAGLLSLFIPPGDQTKQRKIWQWLVIAWVCLDLWTAGRALNPSIDIHFYDPGPGLNAEILQGKRSYMSLADENYLKFRRFFRFDDFRWLEHPANMRAVSLPNMNILDGVYSANNFDPLVPDRYAFWMQHISNLPQNEKDNWLALMNVGVVQEIDMHNPSGITFHTIPDAERIRYYHCAVFVERAEDAFERVSDQLSQGGIAELVLEGVEKEHACTSAVGGSQIRIVSEQAGKMKIQANLTAPGWIFVADTWFPGWEAWVNGSKVTIHRANYLFRAVEAPAGQSEIKFAYNPISFRAGFVLSGFGWFIVLLSIIMIRMIRPR